MKTRAVITLLSSIMLGIHSAHATGVTEASAPNPGEAPDEIVGANTVDLVGAAELFSEGAVFIDVRAKKMWERGHIAGAVHLDVNSNDFMVLYLSDKLDRSTNIVFYGDSPLSIRSALASFFAGSWGYSQVHYFRDGYFAWMAADLPMNMLDASIPSSTTPILVHPDDTPSSEELLSDTRQQ